MRLGILPLRNKNSVDRTITERARNARFYAGYFSGFQLNTTAVYSKLNEPDASCITPKKQTIKWGWGPQELLAIEKFVRLN